MPFQKTNNETPVILILQITHAANISLLLGNAKATLTALKAFFVVYALLVPKTCKTVKKRPHIAKKMVIFRFAIVVLL